MRPLSLPRLCAVGLDAAAWWHRLGSPRWRARPDYHASRSRTAPQVRKWDREDVSRPWAAPPAGQQLAQDRELHDVLKTLGSARRAFVKDLEKVAKEMRNGGVTKTVRDLSWFKVQEVSSAASTEAACRVPPHPALLLSRSHCGCRLMGTLSCGLLCTVDQRPRLPAARYCSAKTGSQDHHPRDPSLRHEARGG